MTRASTMRKADAMISNDQPEYKVYVYHDSKTTQNSQQSWERARTTANRLRAVVEARRLHDMQKYARVEITKKCYDARRQCDVDTTIKIYENAAQKKPGRRMMMAAMLMMAGCMATFYALHSFQIF